MAISPQEAAALSDDERLAVEGIEKHIDLLLRTELIHPYNMPINIDVDHFTQRIIGAVITRYNRVGWDVELNDSGRNWHFIFELGAEAREELR